MLAWDNLYKELHDCRAQKREDFECDTCLVSNNHRFDFSRLFTPGITKRKIYFGMSSSLNKNNKKKIDGV